MHLRWPTTASGFDPARLDRRSEGHLGLRLLKTRVEDLGGTLTVIPGATVAAPRSPQRSHWSIEPETDTLPRSSVPHPVVDSTTAMPMVAPITNSSPAASCRSGNNLPLAAAPTVRLRVPEPDTDQNHQRGGFGQHQVATFGLPQRLPPVEQHHTLDNSGQPDRNDTAQRRDRLKRGTACRS